MCPSHHWSTWFAGSEPDWRTLSDDQQSTLAFQATACEIAFPTWELPVKCLHIHCRIRRGELPKIAAVNLVIRYEIQTGWLCGCSRLLQAKIAKAIRAQVRITGIYDAWTAWPLLVQAGIAGLVDTTYPQTA